MRLTHDEFIESLATFQDMCERCESIENAVGLDPEWVGSDWIMNYFSLLECMCDLVPSAKYGTDLSYYCFDLNFGKNWESGMITDIDGNDIPLGTAEDLWSYLTSEDYN